MSVVSTVGLTRTFGPVTALDGLTVELPSAGVIGLVGPNGSGKSNVADAIVEIAHKPGLDGGAFHLASPTMMSSGRSQSAMSRKAR